MADIYYRFGGKRFNSDSEDSDQEKFEINLIKAKEDREMYLKTLEDKEAIVSDMRTFFSIFKGIVAMGILFLPYGFYLGGFLFSTIVMLICCLLVYMGYIRLIEAKIVLNGDYSEMAEKAFGKIARIIVDILLVLGQAGAVTAYLVYISHAFLDLKDEYEWNIKNTSLLLLIGIIAFILWVPLVWIRHLGKLAVFHMIGDYIIILTSVALITICGYQMKQNGKIGPEVKMLNYPNCFTFIGMGIYSFEAVGIIIPTFQQMKNKKNFNKIITYVMIMMSIFYTTFGLVGYLAFGSLLTNQPLNYSILDQLEDSSIYVYWIVFILTYVYLINLIPTYPLTIYPAVKITESYLFGNMPFSIKRKWFKNITRIILVSLTILLGIILRDQWSLAMSVIGTFAFGSLGFIFPGLFSYKYLSKTKWGKVKDIILVAFGIFSIIFSGISTVIEIKDHFSN